MDRLFAPVSGGHYDPSELVSAYTSEYSGDCGTRIPALSGTRVERPPSVPDWVGARGPWASAATDDTLSRRYPSHADYVAKVTRVSRDLVARGFLLPIEAEQTIAQRETVLYGKPVVCGPLCADVQQFPLNPSSMLLAKRQRQELLGQHRRGEPSGRDVPVRFGGASPCGDRYLYLSAGFL
jgi:hypothetical protein